VATETLAQGKSARLRAKIAILTGNHLCHNPRVIKEACALGNAGYEVEVLGGWFDSELKQMDQALLSSAPFAFTPIIDLAAGGASRLVGQVKSRLSRVAHQSFRFESVWQLGPAVAALSKAADEKDADLFIAHSESAMVAAVDLLKRGKTVGVDMEDWFSEDLLPETRRHRPVKLLRGLESKVLRDGAHKTCTSRAMAEALAAEYDCEPSVVIYNAFPWSDRASIDDAIKDRRDRRVPSIHWYSQTLGPGRGLEDLVAALPFVKDEAEIHLRGKPAPSFDSWIKGQIPNQWRAHVFVHDLVPNDELLSRIAEHDIGFAGEQKYCKSRDLTVTNKILHYLLGGMAVIASDTTGQREIAEQASNAVCLYQPGKPLDLAERLNSVLSHREHLEQMKSAALKAAQGIFCWERQEPKLIATVNSALSR
jgi:glycosyltransferase involved in cell wall biosynthesis